MNAKHTPGPWTIDFNRNTNVEGVSLTFAIHGREKSYITSGQSAEHLKTNGQCDDPILAAECEANGRLIAAAPELLAALEAEEEWRGREAVGELDPEWDYEVMVGAKRRAAIAKAAGSAS